MDERGEDEMVSINEHVKVFMRGSFSQKSRKPDLKKSRQVFMECSLMVAVFIKMAKYLLFSHSFSMTGVAKNEKLGMVFSQKGG